MNLEIDPQLERAIDELIAAGGYESRQEVVREAVELLRSREHLRIESLERLRREVQIGIAQLKRGEGFDADEVFDELLESLPNLDDSAD